MHPLYGALTGPRVQVRVTRSALVAHRYTYVPPRYRTSQYRMIFIPLLVSVERPCYPAFDGVGLAGCKSRANALFLA